MCNNFLDFGSAALNDRIKCNDYLKRITDAGMIGAAFLSAISAS